MKQYAIIIAMVLVLISEAAWAGNVYWSGDGSSQGGNGTWDTTNSICWGTSAVGPF